MRVMAIAWWYVNGVAGTADTPTDEELLAAWRNLPDDGALAFKFFYDAKAPTRLAQHLNGNDWYWLQPTDSGVLFGHSDDAPEEIAARYPGAILKRGKWTTAEDMQRVVAEQAAASYWGDAPLDVSLDGCGGC
jgi:hypothetical protein